MPIYSYFGWNRVPKELISRFVKICPTCQVRRGGSRLTPPNSRRGSPRLEMIPRSPKLPSPPISRRESSFSGLPAGSVSASGTSGSGTGAGTGTGDYFGQMGATHWIDQVHSSRSVHGHGHGHGHVGTHGHGHSHSHHGGHGVRSPYRMPHSMGSLDFSSELAVPPGQLTYGGGYVSHGSGTQREF